MELSAAELLESHQHLASGMLLLCCLYQSLKFLDIQISMELRITFLQLITLSPDTENKEEKSIQFLRSLMLKPDSK